MRTQHLNREDAEQIVMSFKNVDGSGSVTTGMGVSLVQAGASIDGVSAVKYAAGNLDGFCGVASRDVAINSFGDAIVWGYAKSVLISHVGTSITVTRGDILKPGAVAGTFFSSITDQALSTLLYRYVIAATTPAAVSTLAQSYCAGIVKAL